MGFGSGAMKFVPVSMEGCIGAAGTALSGRPCACPRPARLGLRVLLAGGTSTDGRGWLPDRLDLGGGDRGLTR